MAQNEQKEIKKSNWRKKYETIHLLSTIIKRITFLFFSYQAFIYFAFYTFLLMNQFLQPQLETNSQKFENNRNLHVESNSNRVKRHQQSSNFHRLKNLQFCPFQFVKN